MIYSNSIDRMKAIPSEMQVMKLLNDRGLVVDELYRAREFLLWYQKNHVDIVAYPKTDRWKDNKTNMFGIDVKSHNRPYHNLYLETQTRPDREGVRHPSWAFCDFDNGIPSEKHNRYLMDVTDRQNDVSFSEIAESLIDQNNDEIENSRTIIRYFSEHQELLTHDIVLYSYVDIDKALMHTGGADLSRRNDRENTVTHVKEIVFDWENEWDPNYARLLFRWCTDTGSWNRIDCTGNRMVGFYSHPISDLRDEDTDAVITSAREIEIETKNRVKILEDRQANGLTTDVFLSIYALVE